ncbi:hypothetical protein V8E53_002412 [Lactarius tabidus]
MVHPVESSLSWSKYTTVHLVENPLTGASTPHVHPGRAQWQATPQPHPSHLSIPGKPHYHIWGSTSRVHPQGALLGLALAWALISYLFSLY